MTWSEFAGIAGWSLTERGRGENERLLAIQLDAHPGARRIVERGHEAFLPLNSRLRGACTDWQLRPSPSEPLAANDHTDADWDAGILSELADIASELQSLEMALVGTLRRFGGYHRRFAQALDHRRIDDSDQDSCHRVWFELHEDLNATLGISRG